MKRLELETLVGEFSNTLDINTNVFIYLVFIVTLEFPAHVLCEKKINQVMFSISVVLLIKQTTNCSSIVSSTEQKCQLSYRLFNQFNALIFP